jgi:hypothetical protein
MPQNMSKHQPSEEPPHSASDAIPHVPGELLDELQSADSDFSKARQDREKAVDLPSYSDTPLNLANQRVRDAEKHVEDVTEKIDSILHKANSPASTPPTANPAQPD